MNHRIFREDGTVRHLEGRAEMLTDENGKPLRIIGTSQDVTEKKKEEEAIVFKKETPKAEEKPAAKKVTKKAEAPEMIKVEAPELEGPKVLDKIDLSSLEPAAKTKKTTAKKKKEEENQICHLKSFSTN
mgnify:CR=1 FL=1